MKYKIYYQNNKKIQTIVLDALSIKLLANNNLYPKNVIFVKEVNKKINKLFINENEKIELFYELKIMLEANLEIKYIIDILLKSNFNKQNKTLLQDISNSIKNGHNIYENIKHHKSYIGSSIIFFKIAQKNTNFKDAISAMYKMLKIQNSIKNSITELLTYPLILLFSIVFTIVILFIYVIPKFQNIYTQFGDSLPYSTKVLLNIRYYITHEYFIVIAFILSIIVILKLIYNFYTYNIDKLILFNIPIFSKIYKDIIFYKLFLSISLQVNSKESFYKALLNSVNVVNNSYVKSKLQYILADIKNGKSIHYAFVQTNMFDLVSLRLLNTAQLSNQYEELLNNIVNIYDANIKKDINKFKTYYQPLLIFIISSIILWLVLAIMTPIWDLGSVIK